MFVRLRMAKGRLYHAVVESYRDGAKVRHRQVVALGRNSTVGQAVAESRHVISRTRFGLAALPTCPPVPKWAVKERAILERRLARHEERLAKLREVAARQRAARKQETADAMASQVAALVEDEAVKRNAERRA